MTAIVRLTHAELRKLVAARTFLIGLALSVGVAVISVAVDAAVAGKNGTPALSTTANTHQMLKLGSVCCVAMLVLGIISSGSEWAWAWSPPSPSCPPTTFTTSQPTPAPCSRARSSPAPCSE